MKNLYFIWAFYFIGQAINMLMSGNATVQSKINGVTGWPDYFRLRWIPLLFRFFGNTCAFMFIWTNPHVAGIQDYMGGLGSQAAIAGFFGLGSDALFDKVLSLFPWMQKEKPAN